MGIHLCIYDKNGKELPEEKWDSIRHNNDENFIRLINNEKIENNNKDSSLFRPTDISRIRNDLNNLKWGNVEMFYKLLNLLENRNFLYISY